MYGILIVIFTYVKQKIMEVSQHVGSGSRLKSSKGSRVLLRGMGKGG